MPAGGVWREQMGIYIREKCADCKGVGKLARSFLVECPSCNGKGWVKQWVPLKEFLELIAARQQ